MTPIPRPSQFLKSSNATAILVGLFLTAGWLGILVFKYLHFGYYDWDLALCAQTMWSLAHGSMQPSLYGTNFLTNHAELFAFLITPIYAVFPHPITLLVLKILAFTGGAFIFYLIAKDVLGKGGALLLMMLYAFYPPNIYMMVFEFNFENLSIFFIFLSYYLFRKERLRGFMLSCLAGALIKENIALLMAAFFIPALFSKRKDKLAWILAPLLIGGAVFCISMFAITPYLRSLAHIVSPNQYIGLYVPQVTQQGMVSPDFLSSYLKPLVTNLLNPKNFVFLRELLLPLNILPLLCPQVLLINAPIFMQCLLSSSPTMKMIYFHYSATMVPCIFLATTMTLGWFKNFLRPQIFRIILTLVTVSCLITTLDLRANPTFLVRLRWVDRLDPVRWHILQRIPPNEPVIATFDFLAELSQRKSLYTFYKIWMNSSIFSRQKPFPLPEYVRYAIFDWNDQWFWGKVLSSSSIDKARIVITRIQNFFKDDDWKAVFAVDDVVLFQRNTPNGFNLVTVTSPSEIPGTVSPEGIEIPGRFRLEKPLDIPGLLHAGDIIPLNFNWQALENIDSIYGIRMFLKKEKTIISVWRHTIGYGIYPTLFWKKGDRVDETYRILIPDIPEGKYTLILQFVNEHSLRIIAGTRGDQKMTAFPVGTITIGRNHEKQD